MISSLIDPAYFDDNIFTSTTTFVPQITGNYVILCVGAGATGYAGNSSRSGAGGGAGGCGYVETRLQAGTSYQINIAAANSGGVTSFSDIISCTSGTAATGIQSPGANGTCSGNDAVNVPGIAPQNGTTTRTEQTGYNSFSSTTYTWEYLSAGLAGQIGEYPDYGFSVKRGYTYLQHTCFERYSTSNSITNTTSSESGTEHFSENAYGAYKYYGLGGFGGAYFYGTHWRYSEPPYSYTFYFCISVGGGIYAEDGAISPTDGNSGVVVAKLLSL